MVLASHDTLHDSLLKAERFQPEGMTPGKQGFFHCDCHPPQKHVSSSQEKANYFTTRKEVDECARPTLCSTFCSKHFWLLFTLLPVVSLKAMEGVSSASGAHTKAREKRRVVVYRTYPRQKGQFSSERGRGSRSRSWKLTQLKHLTLL